MSLAPHGGTAGRAPVCAIGPDLWFRRESDGTYVIGFTDAAVRRAGSISQYRGPEAGRFYRAHESALTVESEKWVGHVAVPVDGTVVEVNLGLAENPARIAADPYGRGWLYRLRPTDPEALERLAGRKGNDSR
jgi:glycine cleavage system H protein